MSQRWAEGVNWDCLEPYAYSEGSTVIVEENEVGTAKVRQRSTGVVKYHTFDMAFTYKEWDTLKAWVRFNIRGGALSFEFPSFDRTLGGGKKDFVKMRLVVGDEGWFSNFRKDFEEIRITLKFEEQP
jgi:hypothetical protein